MDSRLETLLDVIPPARRALAIPIIALSTVVSRDGESVYASADTLFKGAVFGRDSLEVADDLIDIRPKLVGNILGRMVQLQGYKHDDKSEEEPGKIIHEYRNVIVDGKPIDEASHRIFRRLSEQWGGDEHEMAYYGSVDSTPHFLRTLERYRRRYGDDILERRIIRRDGEIVSVREAAQAATSWIMSKLVESESGFVEYKRINPHGIQNQVWKDSNEFYVHEDKKPANSDMPISSIEVQGLTYDALLAAARIFPKDAKAYHLAAEELRVKVIDTLWQEDRQYFALGTDYDEKGNLRVITTPTANPASLLDTKFFDTLPPEAHKKYVRGIVRNIMSKDFLTDAGIRSRSLKSADLVDFWDYHGSHVSWPKETYDIAKGLSRQGMPKLGRQLENRLLNIVLKSSQYPEFVYVDDWGRVLTGAPTTRTHGEVIFVEGTNTPERLQAWTVSAVFAIVNRRMQAKVSRAKPRRQEPWQRDLEKEVISKIPYVNRYINPLKLLMKYPTYTYALKNIKE